MEVDVELWVGEEEGEEGVDIDGEGLAGHLTAVLGSTPRVQSDPRSIPTHRIWFGTTK